MEAVSVSSATILVCLVIRNAKCVTCLIHWDEAPESKATIAMISSVMRKTAENKEIRRN